MNVPTAQHVTVIARAQGKVVAIWKTDGASANFPIAIDEAGHRLFVGCRTPAELIVLSTDSGEVVARVAISGDPEDVFYDDKRHHLYAVCGAGSIDIINQIDRDTYIVAEKIDAAAGARTGLFVPELESLFVAVPVAATKSLNCAVLPSSNPESRDAYKAGADGAWFKKSAKPRLTLDPPPRCSVGDKQYQLELRRVLLHHEVNRTETNQDMKNSKRKIEGFSAGCPLCNETPELVKNAVSDCGCEVIERRCSGTECCDAAKQ